MVPRCEDHIYVTISKPIQLAFTSQLNSVPTGIPGHKASDPSAVPLNTRLNLIENIQTVAHFVSSNTMPNTDSFLTHPQVSSFHARFQPQTVSLIGEHSSNNDSNGLVGRNNMYSPVFLLPPCSRYLSFLSSNTYKIPHCWDSSSKARRCLFLCLWVCVWIAYMSGDGAICSAYSMSNGNIRKFPFPSLSFPTMNFFLALRV